MRNWSLCLLIPLFLAGCSQTVPRQNHLGLIAAPYGVQVDSKEASNPAPVSAVPNHRWGRSALQKEAEKRV